ncbi:MAG: hypothetical protein ACRCSL_01510 [Microbacterium sp.]
MTSVPLWTEDPGFRAAAAQLADRVRPVEEPRGAVCVVAADGPLARAEAAAAGGASAIILTGADIGARAVIDVVAGSGVPVVVHRPRLRADEAGDAAIDPEQVRLVVADAHSGPAEFRSATVDAIGWIRVLTGGPVVLRAASRSSSGAVAALEGPRGTPVSLMSTRLEVPARAAIRLRAVAPTAVEVDIDDSAGVRGIRFHSHDGELTRPARWESASRLTLRRALDAIAGHALTDLADLDHDRGVAEALLDSPAP